MQRPLENIIFDDSYGNIFPAAAFRRYRSAQPTAKRRLSLREILLMSSMGTARTATISIPDASRSPFQAPLQLRDGALREILLMSSMGTARTATISIPDASRSPFQAPLQLRDGALREILRGDASRCRGEWKLARTTAGAARGAKHRPILRNPETGCTTPYHATTH